jgi:hypothetical protein
MRALKSQLQFQHKIEIDIEQPADGSQTYSRVVTTRCVDGLTERQPCLPVHNNPRLLLNLLRFYRYGKRLDFGPPLADAFSSAFLDTAGAPTRGTVGASLHSNTPQDSRGGHVVGRTALPATSLSRAQTAECGGEPELQNWTLGEVRSALRLVLAEHCAGWSTLTPHSHAHLSTAMRRL